MSDLWNSLQQAWWISYGALILLALGVGLAGAIFLAVATVLGRLLGKYIRH